VTTRTRQLLQMAAGIGGAVLFAALAVYYATAANGHPRVKHIILFVALAAVSALIAWFSLPPRSASSDS
jgi:hypothetical protein